MTMIRLTKTSSNRLAMILIVSLLTVILSANSLFAAKVKHAEELLPADTLIFASVENPVTSSARFKSSSMYALLNDPAFGHLTEQPFAQLQATIQDIEDQLGITLQDLKNISGGQLTGALIETGEKESDNMFTIIANISGNRSIFINKLQSIEDKLVLMSGGDTPYTMFNTNGVSAKQLTLGDGRPCYATIGNFFVVTSDMETMARITATSANNSLAQTANFKLLRSKIANTDVDAFTFINSKLILDQFGKTLDNEAKILLKVLGLDKAEAIGFSTTINQTGVHDKLYIHIPTDNDDQTAGILAPLQLNNSNIESAQFAPSNTLLFVNVSVDPTALFDQFMTIFSEVDPKQHTKLKRIIEAGEVLANRNLKTDILNAFGNEIALCVMPKDEHRDKIVLLIKIKDRNKLDNIINTLHAIKVLSHEGRDVEKEITYMSETITLFPNGKKSGVIVKDDFIVAGDTHALKSYIDAMEHGTLHTSPDFTNLKAKFSKDNNGFGYANLPEILPYLDLHKKLGVDEDTLKQLAKKHLTGMAANINVNKTSIFIETFSPIPSLGIVGIMTKKHKQNKKWRRKERERKRKEKHDKEYDDDDKDDDDKTDRNHDNDKDKNGDKDHDKDHDDPGKANKDHDDDD